MGKLLKSYKSSNNNTLTIKVVFHTFNLSITINNKLVYKIFVKLRQVPLYNWQLNPMGINNPKEVNDNNGFEEQIIKMHHTTINNISAKNQLLACVGKDYR